MIRSHRHWWAIRKGSNGINYIIRQNTLNSLEICPKYHPRIASTVRLNLFINHSNVKGLLIFIPNSPFFPTTIFEKIMANDNPSFILRGVNDLTFEDRPIPQRKCHFDRPLYPNTYKSWFLIVISCGQWCPCHRQEDRYISTIHFFF